MKPVKQTGAEANALEAAQHRILRQVLGGAAHELAQPITPLKKNAPQT